MTNEEPVYCSGCEFHCEERSYHELGYFYTVYHRCKNPQKIEVGEGSFLEPLVLDNCAELNKNNNCTGRKKKLPRKSTMVELYNFIFGKKSKED